MTTENRGKIVIAYHADCIDGVACASLLADSLGVDEKNAVFVPYGHHDLAAAQDKIRGALSPDAQIYFLDVSPQKEFLEELRRPGADGAAKAAKIHIYDHHKTARAELSGIRASANDAPQVEIFIDTSENSAAKMLWKKLNPGTPATDLVELIDRMDGAAKGLKTSDDVAAAAFVDHHDISTPEAAFKTLRNLARLTFNEMAAKGRETDAFMRRAALEAEMADPLVVTLSIEKGGEPARVPLIKACLRGLSRDVSAKLASLAEKFDSKAAFVWTQQPNGAVSMSIRTAEGRDAEAIANYLKQAPGVTGGGHKDSACVHFPSMESFSHHILGLGGSRSACDDNYGRGRVARNARGCGTPRRPH